MNELLEGWFHCWKCGQKCKLVAVDKDLFQEIVSIFYWWYDIAGLMYCKLRTSLASEIFGPKHKPNIFWA